MLLHVISGERLQKAHVEAHFRRDPKTGKLIFIHGYDTSKHKREVAHSVKKGDKMRVENPRSKFHGKEVEVLHYADKYECVRTKVEGLKHTADFKPDHLVHTGFKNVPMGEPKPENNGGSTAIVVEDEPKAVPAAKVEGLKTFFKPAAEEVKPTYNLDKMLAEFKAEYPSWEVNVWDKPAREGKGWYRLYFNYGRQKKGCIEVQQGTDYPRKVVLEDNDDSGLTRLYRQMCAAKRAATGQTTFTLEDAYKDVGILVQDISGLGTLLTGNTFPNKEILGAYGKYDRSFGGYVMTAGRNHLDHLITLLPPYYSKEDFNAVHGQEPQKEEKKSDVGSGSGSRPAGPGGSGHDAGSAGPGAADGRGTGAGAGAGPEGATRRVAQSPREKLRAMKVKEIFDLIKDKQILPPKVAKDYVPDSVKKDLTLFDHQVTGANQALDAFNKGRAGFLLADDTGTGKTYTGAAVVAAMNKAGKKDALIVVPNDGVAKQWAEILTKAGLEVNFAQGVKTNLSGMKGVNLMTYAILGRNPTILGASPDLLVFDEAHNLKGLAEAEQTRSGTTAKNGYAMVLKQMRTNKKVLYATATPWEKPWEAKPYAALGAWDPDKFDSWLQDRGVKIDWETYGGGRHQVKVYKYADRNGSRARKEMLITHLEMTAGGTYLRREVLPEGVKLHNNFSQSGLTQEQRATYNRVMGLFAALADRASWRRRRMVNAQATLWARRYLEAAKVPLAIETAKKELAQGRSVAIMTGYREDSDVRDFLAKLHGLSKDARNPELKEKYDQLLKEFEDLGVVVEGSMQKLKEAFPEAVEYHGGLPAAKRKANMDAFNQGSAKVILATQQSAGTGLSLHDTVGGFPRSQVNVTLPWTALGMTQLAGRTYRLGSKTDAHMHWLFTDTDSETKRAKSVAMRMRLLGAVTKGLDPEESDENYQHLMEFLYGGSDDKGTDGMIKSLVLYHVIVPGFFQGRA